jgi:tungstate transport system permease protein
MASPFRTAVALLWSGDPEVYFITWTSLRFALVSVAIAALAGIPVGAALGLTRFAGKKTVMAVLSSLMALPTVVVGLAVYTVISRSGPLGPLEMLFTPRAVIIGQAILAWPIVASLVASGMSGLDRLFFEELATLGAKRCQVLWMTIREAQSTVLSATLTAFGRVIGEVGIAMILGGNIRWYTRTITTAISLETNKGEFELGLALGIVLIVTAIAVNFLLHWAVKND